MSQNRIGHARSGTTMSQQNFVADLYVVSDNHFFSNLLKVVNAERASYAAPNFARMQERTRSQMLEDLVANLQNHAETGQIPKPYRYGTCDITANGITG